MILEPLDPPGDRARIQRYRPGGFLISGQSYRGAVLVLADRVEPVPLSDVAALEMRHLAALQAAEIAIDLLLIGTGTRFQPLAPALKAELKRRNVAVEVMATPAACRTFNLLMAEERHVAALLLPIGE